MLRLFITAAALNVLLVAPLWWRFNDIGARLIAWEPWLVVPLLLLLPQGIWRRWLVSLWLLWLALISVANIGDGATYAAFGRSFNLYLDLPLVRSVFHLLEGNVGQLAAFSLMGVAIGLLVGVFVAAVRLLLPSRPYSLRELRGKVALGVAVLSALLITLELNGQRLVPFARVPMINTAMFQWEQVTQTHAARQDFAHTLAQSPLTVKPLPGLAGRNVLLTFVESYGMAAIESPRYRDVLRPTLAEMQTRLEARGIHVVSGLLASPIRGGQSWLAHATALSGRKVENQMWYRLLLESDHGTLVDDFNATGHRTLSVMPAITRAWPEGRAYGFDAIYAADDLPYAGPPLHWVTMPDQYTLDYTARHLLNDGPLFAQIALISSHAPWTPILPVLDDWSLIGDGTIFAPWQNAGDPPDVLWQDLERICDHYAWSVDYAVKVAGRFAERVVNEQTLLIILGDHQAAPLITGENASNAVPVHVISADLALLTPFIARGFVRGTQPPSVDSAENIAGMQQLRRWLHADFAAQTQESSP
ncbi:alkaline phosphatase [Halomonas llamarensis]|uniref:Alkaline phosphatase n=1 Tax=Halomonas llamarensis TaxID=2945104 RepID=A0ABT0SQH7_9GAMM|nr:alkaline phosphatase [Halomonas llamarensis]MCL7929833.1 alkaline phosphatase [Halomonas llamarensis]